MSKFISLEKALMENLVKECDAVDLEQLYADLKEKEVTVLAQYTGDHNNQTFSFSNENDIKGNIIACKEQKLEVLLNASRQNLCLKGKTGFESGSFAIFEACSLYNRDDLVIKARSINESDIHYLHGRGFEKLLRNGASWLDAPGFYAYDSEGIIFYRRFLKYGYVEVRPMYESKGDSFGSYYSFRPVLTLNSINLFLDVDSMRETGYWVITDRVM